MARCGLVRSDCRRGRYRRDSGWRPSGWRCAASPSTTSTRWRGSTPIHGSREYLGGVKDRAATEALLRTRILDYYDQHPGLGIWATLERATGAVAGFHVLNHIQGETDMQVGYALFTEYWGRGYASEMAMALLRYGYGTLGLRRSTPSPTAATSPRSTCCSRRVWNARASGRLAHPAYAASSPMAWFESSRDAWLAAHR